MGADGLANARHAVGAAQGKWQDKATGCLHSRASHALYGSFQFGMVATLLSTKLTVPPANPHWISRPRLLRLLDQGLHPSCRLSLVSAPAGYGKTSLLGEWVRGRSERGAWITLDESDNDPARFLSYLVGLCSHGTSTSGVAF